MEHSSKNRIQLILNNLDTTREQLLALSDDIWLSIDHNDNEALKQGTEFKKAYNSAFNDFDKLAQELSAVVQQFTNINLDDQVKEAGLSDSSEESQRIVKILDRSIPHSITENFTHKRPYAAKIEDRVFSKLITWRRTCQKVCQYLAKKDINKFKQLLTDQFFFSNRGKPTFSSDKARFTKSLEITDDIFTEGNCSANTFRDLLKKLLAFFEIPYEEFSVYFLEDKNEEK